MISKLSETFHDSQLAVFKKKNEPVIFAVCSGVGTYFGNTRTQEPQGLGGSVAPSPHLHIALLTGV